MSLEFSYWVQIESSLRAKTQPPNKESGYSGIIKVPHTHSENFNGSQLLIAADGAPWNKQSQLYALVTTFSYRSMFALRYALEEPQALPPNLYCV